VLRSVTWWCGYGGVTGLRGISLGGQGRAASSPDRRNGAGSKSTTLRRCPGRPPRSGSMLFEGKEIAGAKPARGREWDRALSGGRRYFAHDFEENSTWSLICAPVRRDLRGPTGSMPSFAPR